MHEFAKKGETIDHGVMVTRKRYRIEQSLLVYSYYFKLFSRFLAGYSHGMEVL